jgi:hypothetical protein
MVIGAGGTEQTISGGRAEREQGGPHRVGEVEMAMAFELRDKDWQKRHETLGADAIGGQLGNDERLLDGRAIARCPGAGGDRKGQLRLGEEPNSILPGIAGGGHKLVENLGFLGMGGMAIPQSGLSE